jgi:hypothetical protein
MTAPVPKSALVTIRDISSEFLAVKGIKYAYMCADVCICIHMYMYICVYIHDICIYISIYMYTCDY